VEQGSHGKNQEEHGRPKDSHWAEGMRSLMQSFLELLEHSRQQRRWEIKDQSLSCWTPKPPLQGCDIPSQDQAKH